MVLSNRSSSRSKRPSSPPTSYAFVGISGDNTSKDSHSKECGQVQKAIPIISIYFLGYQLEHVQVPVIKVLRNYYDATIGQIISAREEFIQSLTHDSFLIQIPHLGLEYKTVAERLLAVFDQHLKVSSDEHILDIDEAAYLEEYRIER